MQPVADLKVFFNATPVLGKRTGVGQYCLQLMNEMQQIEGLQTKYFYAHDQFWSDELLIAGGTTPDTAGFARDFIKRKIRELMPSLAHDLNKLVRGRSFRKGLEGLGAAVYHEPNYLPFDCALPTVVTVHDLSIMRYPETHPSDRVVYMSKGIVRAIREADCIITDASFVRDEILGEYGIDPERVAAIPLAASSAFKPVQKQALPKFLKPLGLRPGEYILAVGTLEPRKNLLTALNAYARLPERIRQQCTFAIAGMKGWQFDDVSRELEILMRTGQVQLLGYVPDDLLPALYSGATVFVYPSLYEGFGLPPLEAMACGTPVIVSDRSSLPEVVGDAGLLVQAEDTDRLAHEMLRIIEDVELQKELSEAGLKRAKLFSWSRCAEQTLEVYSKVCGR